MSGFGMMGFMAGLNSGLSTGAKLGGMVEDYQLRKVREQGLAEAAAMQAAQTPKVEDQGDMQNLSARPQASADPNAPKLATDSALDAIPGFKERAQQVQAEYDQQRQVSRAPGGPEPAQPAFAQGLQLAAPKRFNVGGQGFDTKEQADSYAKSQAPDMETFYAKTLVPRMRDKLIELGRVDEAQAWEKYAEEKKTKQHMATWSKAFNFAQHGDYGNAAQQLMKLYPDFDDGFELIEATPQKGPNGTEGFLMKVRDSEGNERTVFHDSKTIVEAGLPGLSPIEMFKMRKKEQNDADTMRAKAEIDKQNDERSTLMKFGLEAMRQGGQNSRLSTKLEAGKERSEMVEDRKDARQQKSLDARAQAAADKLRTQVKKTDSPEKVRTKAMEIVARDPMAATMSMEEKQASADQLVAYIKGGDSQEVANPVASGPAAGLMRYDPVSKKMVPIVR